MEISKSVIKQFVDATNDNSKSKNIDNAVYGEVVEVNEVKQVKIDGSSQVTPFSSTANVSVGDRVLVTIKNHTATIIGNTTDHSVGNSFSNITDKNTAVGNLFADQATIQKLFSKEATIDDLTVTYADIAFANIGEASINKLFANEATIDQLNTHIANIDQATIQKLFAKEATIDDLTVTYADIAFANIGEASINKLFANEAAIKTLFANKATIDTLNAKYADIDFANIGEAAVEKIYADYGLIKGLTFKDGTITGELAAVTVNADLITTGTLNADLITAGTLAADRLAIKGDNGLYYKLNFAAKDAELITEDDWQELIKQENNGGLKTLLHGSNIIAQSITANKIAVSDLVAFDATIGGFQITNDAIHSHLKQSVDNTIRGIYLDKTGQAAIGDANNYIKYYKDQNGSYKLEIAAESLRFAASNKTVEDAIDDAIDDINIGNTNLIRNSETLIFDDYYFSGPLISTYDGNSNIEIICGITSSHDEKGNVIARAPNIIVGEVNSNAAVYTPITYIQNDIDAYIDTGVYCSTDMELFIRFKTESVDDFIGVETSNSTDGLLQGISVSNTTGNIELICDGATVPSTIKYVVGHLYEIIARIIFGDSMTLCVKDLTTEEEDTVSGELSNAEVPQAKIGMFGSESCAMAPGQQIEAASIACDGVLVRNYIPVRSGDVVGLYDTIESSFVTTVSGSLIAGEDI